MVERSQILFALLGIGKLAQMLTSFAIREVDPV